MLSTCYGSCLPFLLLAANVLGAPLALLSCGHLAIFAITHLLAKVGEYVMIATDTCKKIPAMPRALTVRKRNHEQ